MPVPVCVKSISQQKIPQKFLELGELQGEPLPSIERQMFGFCWWPLWASAANHSKRERAPSHSEIADAALAGRAWLYLWHRMQRTP